MLGFDVAAVGEDLRGELESLRFYETFAAALGVPENLDLELPDGAPRLRVRRLTAGIPVVIPSGVHVPFLVLALVGEPRVPAAVAVAGHVGGGDAEGARGVGGEVRLMHADAADLEDLLQRAFRRLGQLRLLLGHVIHAIADHPVARGPFGERAQLRVRQRPGHLLFSRRGADHPDEVAGRGFAYVADEPASLGVGLEVAIARQGVGGTSRAAVEASPGERLIKD